MTNPSDSALIIAAIAAAIPSTLAALAAFISSLRNRGQLEVVKERLDGRLSELLNLTKASAFAAGVKTEKETSQETLPYLPPHTAGNNN